MNHMRTTKRLNRLLVRVALITAIFVAGVAQIPTDVTAQTLNPADTIPVVEAGVDQTINEGDKAAIVASVDVLDPDLTTALIDWGDGSAEDEIVPDPSGTISGQHLYTADGEFTITVTVEGVFGDLGVDTTKVTVLNVAPVISSPNPILTDLAAATAVIIVPEVYDPGDDPLTFDWDLDDDGVFGDSSSESALVSTASVGMFLVSLRVEDDQGASAEQVFEISVIDTRAGDPPPSDSGSSSDSIDQTRILLSSSNDNPNRPIRPGERVILRARIVPPDSDSSVVADRVEFTVNGDPLPGDAIRSNTSVNRHQVVLSRGTLIAGESHTFVATAFDANDTELATSSLVLNVANDIAVTIVPVGPTVQANRRATFHAQVDPGASWPVSYIWRMNGVQLTSPNHSPYLVIDPPYSEPDIEISVGVEDSLGVRGTASVVTPVAPAAERPDDVDSVNDLPTGKLHGRAVIGQLVRIDATSIVLTTKDGNDFTDVLVHIDPESTHIAADLDAEAFTTGSKVVVIADREVLSGDAIAVQIRAIPRESTRKHDRVLVSKPDAGNTITLIPENESDGDQTTIVDADRRYAPGDVLVAISRKFKGNTERKPTALINTDTIAQRLLELAQKRFEDGDTAASGLIDELAEKRRELEQRRLDEIKKHKDEAVRRAAERASERARQKAERDAMDPTIAIRRQAVADSDADLVACATRVVGREVRQESDLTDEEKRRVVTECLGGRGGIGFQIPDGERTESRPTPPAEVLECIRRVLGSVPDRPLTRQEEARLKQACQTTQDDGEGLTDPVERRSNDGIDARKRAFCTSNPSDQRCASIIFGNPDRTPTEDEKRAICEANPTFAPCAGEAPRGSGGSASDAEKRAFCEANPTDERCAIRGSSGSPDSDTTKPAGQ